MKLADMSVCCEICMTLSKTSRKWVRRVVKLLLQHALLFLRRSSEQGHELPAPKEVLQFILILEVRFKLFYFLHKESKKQVFPTLRLYRKEKTFRVSNIARKATCNGFALVVTRLLSLRQKWLVPINDYVKQYFTFKKFKKISH